MDGPFYLDQRQPFQVADYGTITLSTTDKALYTAGQFPILGGGYFGFPGKALMIKMFGRITTGATPGNLQWDVYWGTGADANGTIIQSSAAIALSINQTNVSWVAEFIIRCTTIGAAGALFCTGWSLFNVGVVASTLQPVLIPASVPATSGSVDLTAANIPSVQFKRSGSTAETMIIHNMQVIALN